MKNLSELVRPNIWRLEPYSSARNEYSGGQAEVMLDANESPYNNPYNRYPDPLQRELKEIISGIKGVAPENIFVGNGSDEAIDLVYRVFTRPGIDNVVAIEPTYGMYRVCADINDVEYRPVILDNNFQITAERLLEACDEKTKVIWICSPNNPTGNSICRDEIVKTAKAFQGIVVVDEAYGDFAQQPSMAVSLEATPNMIVLNTMSKAWGCAAVRLGMAFAKKEIVDIFNKVKYPYNINLLTQKFAIDALKGKSKKDEWVSILLDERVRVAGCLQKMSICMKVYPSDSNFLLVKTTDANGIYQYLKERGIIVRNRSNNTLCDNCLRMTIGSREENDRLIAALENYMV
ncbi:MAG: histidinol-phosphate transaminase [Prevotella sp.]|nr:histidinol-phosphate transaminase [Prevotella sp.]